MKRWRETLCYAKQTARLSELPAIENSRVNAFFSESGYPYILPWWRTLAYHLLMTIQVVLWFLVALLGTRRVFRLVISPHDPSPSFEKYIGAFILVSIWWTLVGWVLSLFIWPWPRYLICQYPMLSSICKKLWVLSSRSEGNTHS